MEDNISLHNFFVMMKKRFLLIVSILIIVVSLTGLASYFLLTPNYQVSTQILINQRDYGDVRINTQDIQTNLQLINTYNVIIKSPVILAFVINRLNLNTTTDLLTKKVSVTNEQNSQVINITVRDEDLQKAVQIANTTAEVFQEKIKPLMSVDNVIILSPAMNKKDIKPITPNIPLNLVIAAIIGLMIGIGIAFLIEYLDTTIKTEEDIQQIIGIPLLGLISPISQKASKKKKRQRKKR